MRKGIIKLPIKGPQEVHCDFLGAFLFKFKEGFLTGAFIM